MQQGFDDVYEGLRAEGREQIEQFQKFIHETENAKKEIFAANERFLIDLVYRVASMIALKEVGQDRDYVKRICVDIIEKTGVRENIRIRINPGQVQIAGVLKTGLEEYFGKLNNLSIEASPDVPTHGCIVDTQWNSIDATLERQLSGVREALLGKPTSSVVGEG
jgi:flagellar biosynthesis/type III secretory pathway protein FliH